MAAVKTSRVLLVSAVRTANTASEVQQDHHARALRFYLDVTAVPGTVGLSVVLRGYDRISGNAVELTVGGTPVVVAGTYVWEIAESPGSAAAGSVIESAGRAIPFQWDALVKHSGAGSFTYSLSVEVL
jgi:hypothetical protein